MDKINNSCVKSCHLENQVNPVQTIKVDKIEEVWTGLKGWQDGQD